MEYKAMASKKKSPGDNSGLSHASPPKARDPINPIQTKATKDEDMMMIQRIYC